ncbi:protein PLASTID REDOX INSENSITIVE 2, chloroplastic isoform X1 [Actinidia eriantha]|uniref:protein PLASTID REDOX INSENSITIVE 2, chloroplastic isoform X1 n=1 Tax=Actinidia eriantha TaxID=165200 RepID=UPI00258F8D5D|nr:protein PLASTID REDOX INSENSITIVE 2, chloroplastic isoform X1 [Actinidia eriantha]
MALCTSSLTSAAQVVPAKFPTSNGSILRTSWVILRHSPPTTSLPSKSLSERASPYPLRATPPQKYVYPDPIPEFAVSETQKFRDELLTKLSKEKDTFGDELEIVVDVCAEIFSDFLHKEYGGPGTLLVEPFTDMFVALQWKKLPGAAVAARASILWAQNYVDQDWEIWNSKPPN